MRYPQARRHVRYGAAGACSIASSLRLLPWRDRSGPAGHNHLKGQMFCAAGLPQLLTTVARRSTGGQGLPVARRRQLTGGPATGRLLTSLILSIQQISSIWPRTRAKLKVRE